MQIPTDHLGLFRRNNLVKFTCQRCVERQSGAPVTSEVLRATIDEALAVFKESIRDMICEVKREYNDKLRQLSNEITTLKARVNDFDKRVGNGHAPQAPCTWLESRLNRADVLIDGLPPNLEEPITFVSDICKLLGVTVPADSISFCGYISKRKLLLVKFVSIGVRDAVMRAYFKASSTLTIDRLLDTDATTRIYLRDNLREEAKRLAYLCRGLKRKNIIGKFRILNTAAPKVVILAADGSEKTFTMATLQREYRLSETGRPQPRNHQNCESYHT